MPTISEFFGIVIMMYYSDHAPPHFHAKYGKYEALIQISPLRVLKGDLPSTARNLVMKWAKIYQNELKIVWDHAENNKKLQKIPPLE